MMRNVPRGRGEPLSQIVATNIIWDLYNEDHDADDQICLPTELVFEIENASQDEGELADQIVEALTNKFGYCIKQLAYTVSDPARVI
jgi:hypothetical protein